MIASRQYRIEGAAPSISEDAAVALTIEPNLNAQQIIDADGYADLIESMTALVAAVPGVESVTVTLREITENVVP